MAKTSSKGRQSLSKKERREKQVRMQKILILSCIGVLAILAIGFYFFMHRSSNTSGNQVSVKDSQRDGTSETLNVAAEAWEEFDVGDPVKQIECPALDVQLLTINQYSRPGIASDGIAGIVVHYTANPGSTAQDNRDYFESLKDSGATSVSSNFVIGLEGEIIQCIPTDEMAYASNDRNHDTVSIECCHPDETGKFNEATYQSLVELVAFLCGKFNLTPEFVIRHYDVTGKDCPKYFVENEDAWYQFKADVAEYIAENGN